jgi:predicted DNA-binding antitoxin AbrB/MazE fold protein
MRRQGFACEKLLDERALTSNAVPCIFPGMKTVHAVYEKGIFRPLEAVELPERCEVEFEPRAVHAPVEEGDSLSSIYAILSERYESGERDVAARHNEHQP